MLAVPLMPAPPPSLMAEDRIHLPSPSSGKPPLRLSTSSLLPAANGIHSSVLPLKRKILAAQASAAFENRPSSLKSFDMPQTPSAQLTASTPTSHRPVLAALQPSAFENIVRQGSSVANANAKEDPRAHGERHASENSRVASPLWFLAETALGGTLDSNYSRASQSLSRTAFTCANIIAPTSSSSRWDLFPAPKPTATALPPTETRKRRLPDGEELVPSPPGNGLTQLSSGTYVPTERTHLEARSPPHSQDSAKAPALKQNAPDGMSESADTHNAQQDDAESSHCLLVPSNPAYPSRSRIPRETSPLSASSISESGVVEGGNFADRQLDGGHGSGGARRSGGSSTDSGRSGRQGATESGGDRDRNGNRSGSGGGSAGGGGSSAAGGALNGSNGSDGRDDKGRRNGSRDGRSGRDETRRSDATTGKGGDKKRSKNADSDTKGEVGVKNKAGSKLRRSSSSSSEGSSSARSSSSLSTIGDLDDENEGEEENGGDSNPSDSDGDDGGSKSKKHHHHSHPQPSSSSAKVKRPGDAADEWKRRQIEELERIAKGRKELSALSHSSSDKLRKPKPSPSMASSSSSSSLSHQSGPHDDNGGKSGTKTKRDSNDRVDGSSSSKRKHGDDESDDGSDAHADKRVKPNDKSKGKKSGKVGVETPTSTKQGSSVVATGNGGTSSSNSRKSKSAAPSDPEILLCDPNSTTGRKRGIRQSAINKPNRSGRTPIFKYAGAGDVIAVSALIKAGADVNLRDNAGWTPLHEACLEGKREVCELLISYGADVNAPGFGGDTPLHDAVTNGHFEVVDILLSHGAALISANDKGETPMDLAADDEDDGEFVVDGGDGDERDGDGERGSARPTRGRTAMERLLLRWQDMMARVLEVDSEGQTMLHRAAGRGDLKAVRRALRYGAPIDFADNAGWTALHEACAKGHTDVIAELCRYGADVNAVAGSGGKSSRKNSTADVFGGSDVFVGSAKDAVAPDGSNPGSPLLAVGVTPLMDAAGGRYVDAVRCLLEYGADATLADADGRTAADYAVGAGISGLSKAAAAAAAAAGGKEGASSRLADIREMLAKPKSAWEPLRKPEFMRATPGAIGMMASIRDQAAAGRFRKHARKGSIGSETSLSTNPTGSAGFSVARSTLAVNAATAATVGLGGPNPFSWGGLEPRDIDGPFASKRDERKFNAILKTIKAIDQPASSAAGSSGTGPVVSGKDKKLAEKSRDRRSESGGERQKKTPEADQDDAEDDSRKRGRDPPSGGESSDEQSGKEQSASTAGGKSGGKNSSGGGGSSRSKRAKSEPPVTASSSMDEDSGDDGLKSALKKKGDRRQESGKGSAAYSSSSGGGKKSDSTFTSAKQSKTSSSTSSRAQASADGRSSGTDRKSPLAAPSRVKEESLAGNASSDPVLASLIFGDDATSPRGAAQAPTVGGRRDSMALLPSPQADSPASAHPLSSSISSSDPSALSLPSSWPTTDSAGGDRSGKSKLKTEKDKVPSAESAKKSKEISSTMRMPSAAKPSAMGKQRGQSAAGPASAASSSASASSAPNKKKPKKKNWLGISGYQRAGEEAPVSSSAVVEPMEVSSPPPSTQAASGAQRCEDTPATRESSVLSSRQASPERRPVAEGPDVAMTEAKLEPAPAEPGGHVDVKMEDVVLQTPANVEDPMLVKHWRRRCLPLYTIQLPVTQESSPSALAFAPKKSFMVDLQVALFMGLKSGREVLDRFPRLTTRVASLTEKLQLQASPLGEAVLESILDARGAGPGTLPPRYIRWYERRGKRALRLDALDIQFLDADEVVAVFREVVCSGAGDSGGGGGASGSDDGRLWALELREDEVASLDLQAFAEDGGDAAGSGTGGASAAASGSGTVANDGKIAVTPASTPPLLPAGLSAGPALPSASAVGGFAGPAAPSAATPCPSSASSTQAPSVFSTASSAAIVAAATTGVSLTSSAPAPASVPATSFLDPRKKAWRAMTAAAAASSSSSSSSAASMPLAANATSATPGTAPKTSPPSSSSSSSLLGATTAVPPAYPADPPAANAGGESAVAGPKAAAAVDYKYVHKLKRIPNG